ncbi:NADH-ubiquinone oxidoreductase 30.4 kDa subunit [Lentinula boryana]|uniref:NADH-ubiquinone oxidoreductase 30.4 kDa subunit n=1 Tax=Lentinula boryana TaxID=40481 RepID=A0ABQ8Q696_9AGAR|nr:NADH-ubiquinone oxidoreductase 30.4 kDa subunit [Lentinula boryana]
MLSRIAVRPAQAFRAASALSSVRRARFIHGSLPFKGKSKLFTSASPFTEPTSPNPAVERYAQAAESLHTYGSYLMQCLPKFIQQFSVLRDELTLYTAPSGIIPVLTFLRDHSQCQFKSVMDISGVDFPEREKRFEVVYHMLSVRFAGRLRVKTYAGEGDHVPSAVEIFRGADWYEREAWDLFGIFFSGHPDLRRILTDYGFEGHPLRKDFPLTGYTEVRYDEERKRVVYEPLQLTQAFRLGSAITSAAVLLTPLCRNFESLSPWEQVGHGITPNRPEELKPLPPPKAEPEVKK